MDIRTKGIVLSSRDYGEKDKLLTLLTLEYGKITCKARGVKAPKSKLKMQAQPFCFADFELVKTGNNYTLTGGNIIDNFFDIVSNIDKFEYGYAMLEVLDKVCKEDEDNSPTFVLGLKCLKNLCYGEVSASLLFLFFLLNIFKLQGFELNTKECLSCRTKFMGETYLDFESGEIVCKTCKNMDSMPIPPAVFNCLRIINSAEEVELKNIKFKEEYVVSSNILLKKNFENKFMCKLKSFT